MIETIADLFSNAVFGITEAPNLNSRGETVSLVAEFGVFERFWVLSSPCKAQVPSRPKRYVRDTLAFEYPADWSPLETGASATMSDWVLRLGGELVTVLRSPSQTREIRVVRLKIPSSFSSLVEAKKAMAAAESSKGYRCNVRGVPKEAAGDR